MSFALLVSMLSFVAPAVALLLVYFFSVWVLLVINPQWLLKQRWSFIQEDSIQGVLIKRGKVSYAACRALGCVMVVGLILSAVHLTDGIGLGRWAGMAIAAVMAVCFLVFGAFSLVWTFSPNSRLEGESWITAGFPRIRHRALIIRTVGTVTLLLLGLALWEWLQ